MSLKRKMAVFTMDMEPFTDTECIQYSGATVDDDMLDGLDEYIKILENNGIKATLFVMSEAAEKIKDKLKKYVSHGHKIALHGKEHIAPMLQSVDEFREKIASAKSRLESTFGVQVKGYRAPCFSLDNERLNILRELGFKYDSSRFDFSQHRHFADINVSDFEKLTDNVYRKDGFYEFGVPYERWCGFKIPVSGGGYVRMGNWTFCKTVLHQYLKHNDYYVFYLHPFEVSKHRAPYIPQLKGYDKYYLRTGVKSFPHKIENIIAMLKASGYEFVTFEEMLDSLEKE